MNLNLFLVLSIPSLDQADLDDPEMADAMADCFVQIINEERVRNGGPDVEPVLINAIPRPRLLTGEGLAALLDLMSPPAPQGEGT